jgi:hypothetical protein
VVKKPTYAGLCEKDVVKKMLWSYLEDFMSNPENDNPKLIELHIATNISKECFQNFAKSVLLEKIKTAQEGHEMAFRLLDVKKLLDTEERNQYLALYLLKGPINGPIFNQAWNALKLLKKDYPTRQKLLTELLKNDPLPGEMFSLADLSRRKVLMGHFYENFPEYMDQYARVCLDFLQGKKSFPNGNPTIGCDDLFATVKSYKESNWLDKNLLYSYDLVPYREFIRKKKALR